MPLQRFPSAPQRSFPPVPLDYSTDVPGRSLRMDEWISAGNPAAQLMAMMMIGNKGLGPLGAKAAVDGMSQSSPAAHVKSMAELEALQDALEMEAEVLEQLGESPGSAFDALSPQAGLSSSRSLMLPPIAANTAPAGFFAGTGNSSQGFSQELSRSADNFGPSAGRRRRPAAQGQRQARQAQKLNAMMEASLKEGGCEKCKELKAKHAEMQKKYFLETEHLRRALQKALDMLANHLSEKQYNTFSDSLQIGVRYLTKHGDEEDDSPKGQRSPMTSPGASSRDLMKLKARIEELEELVAQLRRENRDLEEEVARLKAELRLMEAKESAGPIAAMAAAVRIPCRENECQTDPMPEPAAVTVPGQPQVVHRDAPAVVQQQQRDRPVKEQEERTREKKEKEEVEKLAKVKRAKGGDSDDDDVEKRRKQKKEKAEPTDAEKRRRPKKDREELDSGGTGSAPLADGDDLSDEVRRLQQALEIMTKQKRQMQQDRDTYAAECEKLKKRVTSLEEDVEDRDETIRKLRARLKALDGGADQESRRGPSTKVEDVGKKERRGSSMKEVVKKEVTSPTSSTGGPVAREHASEVGGTPTNEQVTSISELDVRPTRPQYATEDKCVGNGPGPGLQDAPLRIRGRSPRPLRLKNGTGQCFIRHERSDPALATLGPMTAKKATMAKSAAGMEVEPFLIEMWERRPQSLLSSAKHDIVGACATVGAGRTSLKGCKPGSTLDSGPTISTDLPPAPSAGTADFSGFSGKEVWCATLRAEA